MTVCLKCNRDDQMRKVSAIVNEGTSNLADILKRPQIPTERPRPVFVAGRPHYDLGCQPYFIVLGECLLLGGVIGAFALALPRLFIQTYYFMEHGTPNSVLNIAIAVVGYVIGMGLFLYFPILAPINRISEQFRVEEAERKSRIEQQQVAWEIEHRAWPQVEARFRAAQQRWDRLYYCRRDDCLFLEGEARTVAPRSMNTLLGL